MVPRRKPTFSEAVLRLLFGCFLLGLLGRAFWELLVFGWKFLDMVLR